MYKKREPVVALTAIAVLGGCSGSSVVSGELYPVENATNAVASSANASGAFATSSYTLSIDNNTTAEITVDGTTHSMTRNSDGSFSNAATDVTMFVTSTIPGGPAEGDGDVFFIRIQDSSGAVNRVVVDANGFNSVDSATTGSATYTGVAQGFDASGASVTGTLTLTADFTDAATGLSGTITGGHVGAPGAAFSLVPTGFGSAGSAFSTTLTSTDVAVSNSSMIGHFFEGGDRATGYYGIEADGAATAGFFDAER